MENHSIPKSSWDGQLPPYIAKNEDIWWATFPHIEPILPPKLFGLFGMAKESPPRDIIGKIVLIADTKRDFKLASLLNDWGCFCTRRDDRNGMRYEYMAGAVGQNLPPSLIFDVPWGLFTIVGLRFAFQVNKSLNLSEMAWHKQYDNLRKSGIEMGYPIDKSSKCTINISKYESGYLGKGLNTTFNAALWLNSNREEALANIWKIHDYP